MEVAACSNDIDAARAAAGALGGTLYCDARERYDHLPFRALVTATTDDLSALESASERGLYLVCRRVVKPGAPEVVGLFPMIAHPDLTHAQADAHWRDVHAPLAYEHHSAMTHYSQLSVVHCLAGPHVDGFALCGFQSVEDLRERFYNNAESVDVIAADVRKFSDLKRSPPRLIATVSDFAQSRA